MDLSIAQHQLLPHFAHQEMGSGNSESQSLDNIITNSNLSSQNQQQDEQQQQQDMKKPRPQDAGPQKCPRCESTNTKFCYYNNYSLTQPRYFCKACRRYWTKGGTLRNVPVGGGCRKSSKRSSYASNSPSSHFLKRAHTKEQMVSEPTPNPIFSGINLNPYGLSFDSIMNGNFTDCEVGINVLAHHPQTSFLQELQYGNGGLIFHNPGTYEEINGGNGSNCVSGISEDMAAMAPYEDVLSSGVKQERNEYENENDTILGLLPWQNVNGDQELVRENWNGFIGNSAWSLLNTPALM